jgi:hypothetical protein
VRSSPSHLCAFSMLIYAPSYPLEHHFVTRQSPAEWSRVMKSFRISISHVCRVVQSGFLKHHLEDSSGSVSCLIRRVKRLVGSLEDVGNNCPVAQGLPKCNLNSFKGSMYDEDSEKFADGYVVEAGLDTFLYLPPLPRKTKTNAALRSTQCNHRPNAIDSG